MGETSFPVLLDGAGFQAAAVIVCITGICYMLFRSKPEKIKSKILLWLLVNVLISASCSLIYALTKENAARSEASFALAYATQYLYFLFHFTLAPSFCIYMLHLTGLNYDVG